MSLLEIIDLSKIYNQKKALEHFSMKVHSGEIVGLIGRNGAGKTTMLNSIAGNIYPNTGEIRYNEQNLLEKGHERGKFGISIEASFIDYLNTFDNLRLLMNACGIYDKKNIKNEIEEVLTLVGLESQMKKHVSTFSYGMKQRLGFAQALLNGTEMLILDEPFAGLDIEGRNIVKTYIRKLAQEKKIGVIFSDHNLDEVQDLCHRVVCIQDGKKIYDGIPNDDIKYEVWVDVLNEIFIQKLEAQEGMEIDLDFDKNMIRFGGTHNLHEMMERIMAYHTVLKIHTIENVLEEILKGGGE